MNTIAGRYNKVLHEGGMAGVIVEVQRCYTSAIFAVVAAYALRDCIILGYPSNRHRSLVPAGMLSRQ